MSLRRYIIFSVAICLLLRTHQDQVWGADYTQLKFAQHNYRLIHDHALKKITVRNTKFNRTFSNEWTIIKDLNTTVFGSVLAYKFLNNQYKKFVPMQLKVNICDALKRNMFGVQDILRATSNFTVECPFRKDSYYVSHFLIDESKLPPQIPYGKYRLAMEASNENGVVLVGFSWYGSIEKIIKP